MTEALSALERSAYRSTWVWVLSTNPQAIAFYSSLGFKLQAQSARHFQLGEQQLEEAALVRNATLYLPREGP